MKRILLPFILFALLIGTVSCSNYEQVPPNYLAMKLTPTGFEDHIYTPGQVDIGKVGQNGEQNYLILIQRSGFEIKEQFIGADANSDKEDHRVLTKDRTPMTLDVRLLLALPDHTTKKGQADLKRIFLLANPAPLKDNQRVMAISVASVYTDQARLNVRGRIREIMASYENFNAAFDAFGSKDEKKKLSSIIRDEVVKILEVQNVPLGVVGVQISNMKADESVWKANIAIQAVDSQIEAIKKMGKFLRENPDMRDIYKYMALKEIAEVNASRGNNTMILTDIPGASRGILPVPSEKK